MRTPIVALACAAVLAVPAFADAPAGQTMRQFLDANCQDRSDACTKPIAQSLTAAAVAGKIAPGCFGSPTPALDIALWLSGHHDLDDKPMADAAVITALRLWPACKVQKRSPATPQSGFLNSYRVDF